MRRVLQRAVGSFLRWAVVEDDGADRGPVPWQQIRSLGQAGRSVAWYPYGFHAVAPAGSLGPRGSISGQADAQIHFPGSPKERPRLKPGEVAVYHPTTGSFAIFRADGSIEISTAADLTAAVAGDVSVDAGGTITILAAGSVAVTAAVAATVTAPTITLAGNAGITGHLDQDGANIGFRGSTPIAKPVIDGTKTGGTAQNQLLIALDAMGIIDDQT